MRQPCDRPSVEVNINVNVVIDGVTYPMDGGPAEPAKPSPKIPKDGEGSITIILPSVSTGMANVAGPDSTGQYYICSTGTVSAQASGIDARVYQGQVSAPANPCVPSSDNYCKRTDIGPQDGGQYPWQFDSATSYLPLPNYSPSGPSTYTVVVWAIWAYGPAGSAARTFTAVPSSVTDCDSYTPTSGPVLAARHVGGGPASLAPLIGIVQHKAGRFSRMPDQIELRWNCSQQGWTWDSRQAQCGSFTVLRFNNWYLLQSSVTNPPLIPAGRGSTSRPLQLSFAVITDTGDEPGTFTLEIREGS
jgi:hypothetical protein